MWDISTIFPDVEKRFNNSLVSLDKSATFVAVFKGRKVKQYSYRSILLIIFKKSFYAGKYYFFYN